MLKNISPKKTSSNKERLQRIEQTVSQQSSISQKRKDKKSSHIDRMWQFAGYRRCQTKVSLTRFERKMLLLLLLLPATNTNTKQRNVTCVFFVFFEEKMFDGVPPSCVEQLIKVVCFIRSAFLLICVFASAAWENFLSVQVKNEMHIFAKF